VKKSDLGQKFIFAESPPNLDFFLNNFYIPTWKLTVSESEANFEIPFRYSSLVKHHSCLSLIAFQPENFFLILWETFMPSGITHIFFGQSVP
jgi:hypothetical protein